MTLAGSPKLVLLDEPLAGMGLQESEVMSGLIGSLRGEVAVLLIEHDVDAVFRLADTVSVLVSGHVVASGKPEDVRRDPVVADAYLGSSQEAP
jgi:branched-chain amino acid transport system ATP-binding protein